MAVLCLRLTRVALPSKINRGPPLQKHRRTESVPKVTLAGNARKSPN